MAKGKFIVFEGINGCGKGTQIDLFSSYLRRSGKAVPIFLTGEPNDFDENGKRAREILASDRDPYENALESLAYFSKNRLTHKEILIPLLQNGVTVICDRYYHSTFAYQHAQGVPYEKIAEANENVLIPDLTFILDININEAFSRLSRRDSTRRKFDSNYEFMKKVKDNYLELPNILSQLMGEENIQVIDGNSTKEFVFYNLKKRNKLNF
jgi:dTMP kinase